MTTVGGRRKYDLVGWSVVVLVVLEGGLLVFDVGLLV